MHSALQTGWRRKWFETRFLLLIILFAPCAALAAQPIQSGDRVRLKAFTEAGVPVHPAAGETTVSARLPGGAIVTVRAVQANWLQIEQEQVSGWIITRYVGEVVSHEPATSQPTTYVIGTWNLEHFHEGVERGFPENRNGGPTYPPRGAAEYAAIADIIRTLDVKIMVLDEVYAETKSIDGEEEVRSDELEQLLSQLPSYDYIVGASGGNQHVALIYDERCVRLNVCCETDFSPERIEQKAVFDRQALIGDFTFVQDGRDRNDLVVVGVHLASGQDNARNHDRAMQLLVQRLATASSAGGCLPPNERDILIAGDFNASRFDAPVEKFWDELEHSGWDVLADDPDTYPPTRLAGVPLRTAGSCIDYMIVTQGNGGLQGEEIQARQATVHRELVGDAPEEFRRRASDHLPVTIAVRVTDDSD